jgi:uncharacterized membrane protein
VAAIGLIGFVFLFTLSRTPRRGARIAMLFAALLGLAFCLYLTYIEAYVLGVWCILCLGTLAMIVGIAGLSGVVAARKEA